MKTIEELKKEMQTLMDLELIRMKQRHFELMCWAIPRLLLAISLGGLVAWMNWRLKP